MRDVTKGVTLNDGRNDKEDIDEMLLDHLENYVGQGLSIKIDISLSNNLLAMEENTLEAANWSG